MDAATKSFLFYFFRVPAKFTTELQIARIVERELPRRGVKYYDLSKTVLFSFISIPLRELGTVG